MIESVAHIEINFHLNIPSSIEIEIIQDKQHVLSHGNNLGSLD
jgi:hypothetical protein